MKAIHKFFTIQKVYFLVFLSLVSWAFFAYYTMSQQIENQQIYAKIINLSGKQRMLSQKTTLISKRVFESKNDELKEHLKSLFNEMKNDHNFIINNLPSKNMENIYHLEPYELNNKVITFFNMLERFIENEDEKYIQTLQDYSFRLLPLLNHAVYEFENESNQMTKELKNRELFILIGTLFTLILESLLIVLPALKRIEKKERELEELNNSLEKKIQHEINEIKKKDEIITHQSKMSAMGEMLANIAHQWRQPLSIISTAASGIKVKKEYNNLSDEELLENLDGIVKSAQYLSKTIDDFRDFFRPNKIKENFKIKEVFFKSMELLSSKFQNKDIKVITNINDELTYNGYKNEMIQVLINILNNASDALEKINDKKRLLFINTYTKNQNMYIEIYDNAGGVPKNIKDKIFEPYFTTKHKSKGTGIGLYMSFQIINEHFEGDLKQENISFEYKGKKHKGAKFCIQLPQKEV